MPKVSDITTTALSFLPHIDALLDIGPDWNFMTPVGNTIQYTFSVSSGNEAGATGQTAFSIAQQAGARSAFDYISKLTGINFVATADGAAAQIHLCNTDIAGATTSGLCSWNSSYESIVGTSTLTGYSANAYVYLDNNEWSGRNSNLVPGSYGYETLLHELGHALGLKHPFEGDITLPAAQNNTSNTLMAYNEVGGPHATFSPFDIAALNWLYGGDGLRGAYGLNSTTGARLITGSGGADIVTHSSFNITLDGDQGNDMINGGDGIDTVVFRGARSDYAFSQLANGDLQVSSAGGGSGTLESVEILQFSNGTYQSAQIIDNVAPAAPTMSVTKNAANYVLGASAFVVGVAEAGATVKVYTGSTEIGSTKADANGVWSLTTSTFPDGLNYQIFAKATDNAGNTSSPSASLSFNVDAHPPLQPTGSMSLAAGSNQPVFDGIGEVGTTIFLVNGNTLVGKTTVAANGAWHIDASPLSNGNYNVAVISADLADNNTSAKANLTFTIASSNNLIGTDGNDRITPSAGNNAVEGGAGTDTAVYAGARANYTVAKDVNGYVVTDRVGSNGTDSLINVERIQFADGWMGLDVNGIGGQAYRLYQAAFDRAPDLAGLGYWIKYMDAGMTLNHVSELFIGDVEFKKMYEGANDHDFLIKLYDHVLHRAPDQSGLDFWQHAMVVGDTRADVLAFFSESPENQAQVMGSIENGFAFIPWTMS